MGSWKVGDTDTLAGWADPDFPLVGRGAQFGMCPPGEGVELHSCCRLAAAGGVAIADWPRSFCRCRTPTSPRLGGGGGGKTGRPPAGGGFGI